MWLKSITLKQFRNYTDLNLSFSPHLNIFLGKNAQGKTNLLESIYFLSLTRSHRTRSDKELIQFNQKELTISGEVSKTNTTIPLELSLSDRGRMTKVNHLKQGKLSDYIGNMTVVLFAPEDLQLVKGSPSLRRKFIDIDLGQIKTIYLSDLSQYHHVLKQRNAYLKTAESIDVQFLSVLDEQVAHYGTRVIQQRLQFVKDLEKEAKQHHLILSNKSEELSIHYQSTIVYEETDSIYNAFLEQLTKNHRKDQFKKTTSIGPHRDDILFYINGIEAKFASQGQHRSLVLSIKMAEIELIKTITGDYPILLLDDVMSELDYYRQTKLLEGIKENVQTFITTTNLEHLSHLPKDLNIFTIENGTILEQHKPSP